MASEEKEIKRTTGNRALDQFFPENQKDPVILDAWFVQMEQPNDPENHEAGTHPVNMVHTKGTNEFLFNNLEACDQFKEQCRTACPKNRFRTVHRVTAWFEGEWS